MTKKNLLEVLMLLSALESWSYVDGRRLPDWLVEKLEDGVEKLKAEILSDEE